MKEFLIWWLRDATFGEYLTIAWLMDCMIVILACLSYAIFYHLREWFETRHGRKK